MRSALPAELNCQHGALARIHCLRPFRRARGLPARRKVCPKSKSSASVEPLLLGHSSGCPIHIFGVEHLKHQTDAADFILRTRPSIVVVETALDAQHGAATGNRVGLDDASTTVDISMLQQIGRRLSWEQDPLGSPLWQKLKPNCGEQLVYVAALGVSADIVYGDRPKHDTYRRLWEATSLAELDYAFGLQSWLNYQELLNDRQAADVGLEEMGSVDHIMLTEREATFCSTLYNVAQGVSEGGVVGVLGEAHLQGVQRLWAKSQWQEICSEASSSDTDSEVSSSTQFASSTSQQGPSGADGLSREEAIGVRHALLESTMRLKSVASVVNDLRRALPVPEPSWEPYCWAHEMYAHPRMLLASLSRDQLARVCSGWRCDMWIVLEQLRSARPVNGGSGLDIDLAMRLRGLDIQFADPSQAQQAVLS